MVFRSNVWFIGVKCNNTGGSDEVCVLMPLVWAAPLAICCDGMCGACNAEIAVVADGPDVAVLTVCGRAVDSPVAGSALLGGQSALAGFFRCAQLLESVLVVATPLVCAAGCAVIVVVEVEELVELVEAIDDEEFCRWTVFRGAG